MAQANHRKEMEEDLMRVFREVSRKYECGCNREACRRVVEHPAPRFYIDARRAHQRISPLLRGDTSRIDCLSPIRKEMYLALFDTVQRMWQKSTYWGKSLYYVLQFAVLQPAPRFYIDGRTMERIWLKHVRKNRKKKE